MRLKGTHQTSDHRIVIHAFLLSSGSNLLVPPPCCRWWLLIYWKATGVLWIAWLAVITNFMSPRQYTLCLAYTALEKIFEPILWAVRNSILWAQHMEVYRISRENVFKAASWFSRGTTTRTSRISSTSASRASNAGGENSTRTIMTLPVLHEKKDRAGRLGCPTTKRNVSRKSFWAAPSTPGILPNAGLHATSPMSFVTSLASRWLHAMCDTFYRRSDSRRKNRSWSRTNIPTRLFFVGLATRGSELKKSEETLRTADFRGRKRVLPLSDLRHHLGRSR